MKAIKKSILKNVVFIIFLVVLCILSMIIMGRMLEWGVEEFILYPILFDALALYVGITIFTKGKNKAKKILLAKENASILLMLIPIIISFAFTIDVNVTDKENKDMTIRLYPGLMSSLFGIALITPLMIRNAPRELFNKVSTYAILLLDVLFASTFLNILVDPVKYKIKFLIFSKELPFSTQTFVIFAIVFSWIGIRELAGFIWAGIFIVGAMRLTHVDNAMGFYGAIYIVSAFISVIIQWKAMDFNISFGEFKQNYIAPATKQIIEDVSASGHKTAEITKKAKENLENIDFQKIVTKGKDKVKRLTK